METCRADIYALRAFLDDYFNHKQGYIPDMDIWYPNCCIFTCVNSSANGTDFSLRRIKHIFSHYDVLNFHYSSGRIEVQKKELKTERDRKAVKGLVAILEQKPYGQLISNLDELRE